MISHDKKLIFIHIPKCAGTSIEAALGHLEGRQGRKLQDHRALREIEPFGHLARGLGRVENLKIARRRLINANAREAVNNPDNAVTVTPAQYASYLKATVIRDPWSRSYSWYRNVIRDEIHMTRMNVRPDMPFEDFLRAHLGTGSLRSQLYWLKDFSGKVPMDVLIRFEALAEGFATLCDRLGLEAWLEHRLAGKTGNWRDAYSGTAVDLVARAFPEEIALFDYNFDRL